MGGNTDRSGWGWGIVGLILVASFPVGCGRSTPLSEEQEKFERVAGKLDEAAAALKRTVVHFETAEAASFDHLDIAWYDTSAQTLNSDGFERLEDIVLVEHNQENPNARTFIRVLVSKDRHTTAGLWHYWDTSPAAQEIPSNDVRVLDLETEFTDGSFAVTTNMPPQGGLDMGAMVDRSNVQTQDLIELRRAHEAHLVAYGEKYAGLVPREVHTLQDLIAAQQRMQQVKGTYRQEMEIPFTEDELNHATDNRFQEAVRGVSDILRDWFPSGW